MCVYTRSLASEDAKRSIVREKFRKLSFDLLIKDIQENTYALIETIINEGYITYDATPFLLDIVFPQEYIKDLGEGSKIDPRKVYHLIENANKIDAFNLIMLINKGLINCFMRRTPRAKLLALRCYAVKIYR